VPEHAAHPTTEGLSLRPDVIRARNDAVIPPPTRRPILRTVLLLLGVQVLLFWNQVRRGTVRARIAWAAMGAALLAAASFLGAWGYALGRLFPSLGRPEMAELVRGIGLAPELFAPDRLLVLLVSVLVTAVWGLILLGGMGSAIEIFYLSSDLELLLAAPIPMRAIFAAKFLQSLGLGYLMLFALAGPALIGLGVGAHFAAPYFLGCLVLLGVLPLLPQSVGMLVVMPLVRLIPPQRLREALSAVGALLATGFYLLTQWGPMERVDAQALVRTVGFLQRGYSAWLPPAWAALGLNALSQGAYGQAALLLGALAVLTAAVYLGCLWLAERLYYTGWANFQAAPRVRGASRKRSARSFRDVQLLPRPLLALVAKDLRLFLRTPQYWTQLLMPLAAFVVLLMQSLRTPAAKSLWAPWIASLLQIGMILLLGMAAVARLGLAGVGSEGPYLWVLRTAPLSARRILWAKWFSAYLPYLALSSLMLGTYAFLGGLDGPTALAGWLYLALAGAGTNAIAVGLGTAMVRLERERTGRPYSPAVGCLYFPLIGGYAAVLGLALALALTGEIFLHLGWVPLAWISRTVGFGATVALACLGLWLPLKIGAERLARLE